MTDGDIAEEIEDVSGQTHRPDIHDFQKGSSDEPPNTQTSALVNQEVSKDTGNHSSHGGVEAEPSTIPDEEVPLKRAISPTTVGGSNVHSSTQETSRNAHRKPADNKTASKNTSHGHTSVSVRRQLYNSSPLKSKLPQSLEKYGAQRSQMLRLSAEAREQQTNQLASEKQVAIGEEERHADSQSQSQAATTEESQTDAKPLPHGAHNQARPRKSTKVKHPPPRKDELKGPSHSKVLTFESSVEVEEQIPDSATPEDEQDDVWYPSRHSIDNAFAGDRSELIDEICKEHATAQRFAALQAEEASHRITDPSNRASIVETVLKVLEESGLVPDVIYKEEVKSVLDESKPEPPTVKQEQSSDQNNNHAPGGKRVSFATSDRSPTRTIRRGPQDRRRVKGKVSPEKQNHKVFVRMMEKVAESLDLDKVMQFHEARCPTKADMPSTPWTSAHPRASIRPRTSLRVLMLEQDKLRVQHTQKLRQKQAAKEKHAQQVLERRRMQQEKHDSKENRKARWKQALQEVEVLVCNLRENSFKDDTAQNQPLSFMQVLDGAVHDPFRPVGPLSRPIKTKSRSLAQRLGFVSVEL